MKKFVGFLFLISLMQFNNITYAESDIEFYQGWTSAFDKDPTDHTYEYHLELGNIDSHYDVYLAVPECSRIGETGMIILPDGDAKSYQVFDCASRNVAKDGTINWMLQNNIVAEVDYYTWQEHGLGQVTLFPGNDMEIEKWRSFK